MDPIRNPKPAIAAVLAAAALATAAPAGRLPPSWPKGVPVPPGQIQGTNIGPGHAVVQLIVRGSARQALRSTIAFYRARGWRGTGPGLHKGSRKLVVVTENRDHSAAKTFVVISVTPYPA